METYRNGIRVEPDEGYNGWTNAETWHTKLVMDNDEGSYNYWRERAEAVLREELDGYADDDDDTTQADEDAAYTLAKDIEAEHEETAHEFLAEAPYWLTQYVRYGLGATNWVEIAESLISDAREAVES